MKCCKTHSKSSSTLTLIGSLSFLADDKNPLPFHSKPPRMKRFNKAVTVISSKGQPHHVFDAVNVGSDRKCGSNLRKVMGVFVVLVMGLSVLFSLSVLLRDPPSDGLWNVVETGHLDFKLQKALLQEKEVSQPAEVKKIAQPVEVPEDKLLGNLLPTGFDEKSCLSRYQSLLYRRGVPQKASPYLISKLRSYEARHKKCGPYSNSYNKTVEGLKSGRYSDTSDCKYVVWISFSGLGNRILTLASAFLYALLTDRILLVDPGRDIPHLFCEPFPDVSWLLPVDFPLTNEFSSFNQKSHQSYGNMLKRNSTASAAPQPYIYLHLVHDYDDQDKLFFCDQEQAYLHKIPWLIMKSDNYFVPSLFLMPSFQQELHALFPEKETVFHLLGRYLFHPTNSVWGLITRFYDAYLSKADVVVGIQVRVFDIYPGPYKHIMDQILSCTMRENILPRISQHERRVNPSMKKKTVAVLMTSLTAGYYEQIKDMYWENPTTSGEVITVFQPSHEGHQQTEKQNHNRKAWAEMYLLSLTDKLVTSSWSTFGYVAQGLGGLKPWILYKTENHTTPEPPCRRAMSMEPCFHAPPFYDCRVRRGADSGAIVPHVRHCEDVSWGLKLFQHHSDL